MGRVLLEPGVGQAAVSAMAANAESVVAYLIMGPLLLVYAVSSPLLHSSKGSERGAFPYGT
ncbi:hypothetical protein HK16_08525 [Acetobacter senegalensis]|uniref:Uncharacterized protein n=2 Tax=Acetobacter TaxID=434 RepID=A0A252EJJ1_9PROT|nr:hypothetical protein CIW82_07850 [Acetobacter tropicalis]OUL66630.1 hypothetical protein HK16_08525 [Acetobacter senegalensis]